MKSKGLKKPQMVLKFQFKNQRFVLVILVLFDAFLHDRKINYYS